MSSPAAIDAFERELAAKDPALRAARGVWFTPDEIVGWMVRSVDALLRRELGESRGLRAPRVAVLDPAAGTGAFLRGVAEHAPGARLFGREILRRPCAIARASLRGVADVRGGDALSAELEPGRRTPIPDDALLVVLGNPPYKGDAPARGAAIERLMEDYKRSVRGEERQIQRLSNDYVRFFRLAQELVERRGEGIIAFVSDAGYLDGVLFRDMRAELQRAAARAWVLDLGGGVRGGARAGADGNVFSIRQPVAIGLFVFHARRRRPGEVRFARMTGTRAEKLAALSSGDVTTTRWETISPRPPAQSFRPSPSGEAHDAYATWIPLLSVAGTGDPRRDRDVRYGTGIKTRHDAFVVAFDAAEAVAKVRRLARRGASDEALVRELGLCTTAHFDLHAARARAEDPDLASHVRPIAYRPFDTRYVVYLREFVCEPKARTMRHLLDVKENVALTILRRDRTGHACGYFAAAGLVAKDFVSNVDDALVWPMLAVEEDGRRVPNAAARWLEAFGGDVRAAFAFTYALLFSPWYRATFAAELSQDYPRLPLPRSETVASALARVGARLLDLHLLRAAPRQIHEDGAPLRIGAFRPCDAWLKARRGRVLSKEDRRHHARVLATCAETIVLARDVDSKLAELGGFRAAFR